MHVLSCSSKMQVNLKFLFKLAQVIIYYVKIPDHSLNALASIQNIKSSCWCEDVICMSLRNGPFISS